MTTARHLIFFFLVFGGAVVADQYQYDRSEYMNTKADDCSVGFMAGYWGKPCPDDASDEFKDAYGRGYEVSERESARAGETV